MSLFVACNRGAPFAGPYRVADQCRFCWLYFNDGEVDVARGFRGYFDRQPPLGHFKGEPPAQIQPPSLGRRILNWAEDTAKWTAAGCPVATDDVVTARKAICVTNQCLAYDTANDRCNACGCPLHATALGDKLKRATSECPRGLWLAIEAA